LILINLAIKDLIIRVQSPQVIVQQATSLCKIAS